MFPSQLTPDNNTDIRRETIRRDHKEKGKRLFREGSYAEALQSFQAAQQTSSIIGGSGVVPSSEREILLSNIVACRLKIGGKDMASAAVEESKQCILLNDRWAKAYVRLASSYIALGGHSNDACNALQNAIRLDPGHSAARKMLVQQLRRDDRTHGNEYTNNGVSPSVPTFEEEGVQPPASSQQRPFYSDDIDDNDGPLPGTDPHDDNESYIDIGNRWLGNLMEKINQMTPLLRHRYDHLSEEWRSLLKVIIILLVLYVAIGGRFGFDQVLGSTSTRKGDYGTGNAYDRYRSGSAPEHHRYRGGSASEYHSSRPNDHYTDDSYHRSTHQYSSSHETRNGNAHRSHRSRRPTSYDSHYSGMMPYGLDGSTSSMALMMLLVFALNRARAFGRGAGAGIGNAGIGMGRWNHFGGLGMLGPMAMGFGRLRGPGMRFQFGGGGGGFGFGAGRRRWR